jgi:hypothetical protein
MVLMETPNTTAAYINHESFDEPMPLNYRDQLHVLIGELAMEGKMPGFEILLGPQVTLPR